MANNEASREMLKTSDFIVRFLYESGVRQLFELSGGMITHLLNSLYEYGKIRVVSMHHEQSAAFAADVVGRLTNMPGVAIATSGPGACNLLTGIGSCYFDSSPAVFITGQVNRSEQKGDRKIRQLGFQETDIVAMAEPITKAAWRVGSSRELPELLLSAFRLAVAGRPGPVLIDIPMDVQREQIPAGLLTPFSRTEPISAVEGSTLETTAQALFASRRPLILVGGGVRASGAMELARGFAEACAVPVVHSLMGADVLPGLHPLQVGLIGSYGNRWANYALAESDLLLVLGSRLDIRQTGANVEFFRKGRTIIHVDCELDEINNRVQGCYPVVTELRPFLSALLERVRKQIIPSRNEWLTRIAELRSQMPDRMELRDAVGINPNAFIHQLSRVSGAARSIVTDVGQHQMWAAQSFELSDGQRWLTSGGMGSMGFALPAAIGASIVTGQPSLMIAGDGSFQCNLQELQTVVQHKLPVKMVILNNRCLGMVRQFQKSYFNSQYQSTYWGYSAPDFARIADAFGIFARRVSSKEEVDEGLASLWREPKKAALLDVSIDTFTPVYPKIAFGRPLMEMEPDSSPIGLETIDCAGSDTFVS